MAATDIEVEVAYALPDDQFLARVRLPAGATVEQAIAQSGVTARYPQITHAPMRVGVFGRFVALSALLENGDRVEIYRPLTVEPKEARRRRVKIKNTIKSNI